MMKILTRRLDLAAGKEGPVPYKGIVPSWREFINPRYLPEGIEFKEPSRYLSEECHSILRLWRMRQGKGEIVFKFELTLSRGGESAETEYPEDMFEGLQPPGPIATSNLHPIQEESPESDSEVEVFHRR